MKTLLEFIDNTKVINNSSKFNTIEDAYNALKPLMTKHAMATKHTETHLFGRVTMEMNYKTIGVGESHEYIVWFAIYLFLMTQPNYTATYKKIYDFIQSSESNVKKYVREMYKNFNTFKKFISDLAYNRHFDIKIFNISGDNVSIANIDDIDNL